MQNKGLVHIYTGDGKGKTTAAIGLAVRAAGAGKKVLFAQFMKGRPSSEIGPLESLGIAVLRSTSNSKFVFQMNAQEKQQYKAENSDFFDNITGMAAPYNLLILDEIISAVTTGMLTTGQVANFIQNKPLPLEVVLTGRDCPEEILQLGDYISNINCCKHPYNKGVEARKGIEF